MSEKNQPHAWPQPYQLLDARPYWEALDREELMYQRCASCKQSVWPAHSYCPHCGSPTLDWQISSGRGTVYSFSTVMRGPTAVWASLVPYTVGFVQMAEGHFLFAQIDGPADSLSIGKPVKVTFIQRGAQKLPIFALAE